MMPRLYTKEELRAALVRDMAGAWMGVPLFLNSTYCAVTKEWVEDRFAPYILRYQQARGQVTYKRRGNQCEHYAIRAALEAVDLLRQMPDDAVPAEAESMAVATVIYTQGAGTPAAVLHMINLWFVGGFWREWEPQTTSWISFTPAERQSVQSPIIF